MTVSYISICKHIYYIILFYVLLCNSSFLYYFIRSPNDSRVKLYKFNANLGTGHKLISTKDVYSKG